MNDWLIDWLIDWVQVENISLIEVVTISGKGLQKLGQQLVFSYL